MNLVAALPNSFPWLTVSGGGTEVAHAAVVTLIK